MFYLQGSLPPVLSLLLSLILHPHRTLFDQDEALIDKGPADDEYVHLFNIHHMKHISLRALCHLHNNQQAMSVITLLSKRHQLRLDDEDHVNVMANPNLVPRLAPHYLDYTLSLPNVDIDHNWTAKLQLSMANQFWPDNAINSLPFDPKGHPLHPSISQATDMGYHMRFDRDPILFFSGHFGQGNRTINLCLTDLQRLHQGFLNRWHPWVTAAPQSWKVDGFLTQNALVGITLQYGQNQPLLLGQNADLECHNWDRDRKYAHIRQVSFSLATHISYLNVNGWSAIDRALIQQANPVIYDKPDDDPTWEQVDLADLPLVDEDGFEINVYNPDGFRIPRWKPTGFETCGALLDLKKVHELFQGTEDAHGHVQNEVPFTVYPLAFT
ncbi:hypothetical protein EDC04DRAFT_2609863 [Pisolithus marmoratus]|nr:hypothetical protein EDC04DRAFT_2609863 [Pisolithus marmoratus]